MKDNNLGAHGAQRVALFIDTQNLYHSAKSNYRANVNYQELLERAVSGRQLVRAFAYVIRSEEATEAKFFDAVEEMGIEIRVKDLQVFHTGAKKGDWDVGIAVDMIRLSEKVDVIVLASGDGDFIEVMRYCQSRGVRVEIMAFEKTSNNKLMEEADLFVDLGTKGDGFLIGGRSYVRKTSEGDSYYRRANQAGRAEDLNRPSYYRSGTSRAGEVDGRREPTRTYPAVTGIPARTNMAPKARNTRRIPARNIGPSNVFGNKRPAPAKKVINKVKKADDQKFNWFGNY